MAFLEIEAETGIGWHEVHVLRIGISVVKAEGLGRGGKDGGPTPSWTSD